ncbi:MULTISPECIES: hypothetical protein [unclassified Streptomyces]|uniref:hypothetical protein n=1 Tax=unclassified Streptomyces TaxID=2593676 RepID=UPI003806D5FE
MAVRNQLIHRSPQAVRAVLADLTLYGEQVAGPSESTSLAGHWPETGSPLCCTVRPSPWSTEGARIVDENHEGARHA